MKDFYRSGRVLFLYFGDRSMQFGFQFCTVAGRGPNRDHFHPLHTLLPPVTTALWVKKGARLGVVAGAFAG
jgi:hypothetical protein